VFGFLGTFPVHPVGDKSWVKCGKVNFHLQAEIQQTPYCRQGKRTFCNVIRLPLQGKVTVIFFGDFFNIDISWFRLQNDLL